MDADPKRMMTLNVRLGGALSRFVSANVGDDGAYENVSEYVRDLIRRDMEQTEQRDFERLRGELQRAFAERDDRYVSLTASALIDRVRKARPPGA